MQLDPQTCYRALTTRDPRFDGLFFVGVTTTRIYCRPVCTARTPRSERCRFFALAAAAEQAGFRPCLRCRPELAPGHSPIDAVGRVARAAAKRIEAGALDRGAGVDDLAAEFGLGARQLRRAVRRELGVSPVELAQTQRLLLAKQLLTETHLPMIEVALASGFESVRRFNALFLSRYRMPPTRLRRARTAGAPGEPLRLRLGFRPPLDWQQILDFLAPRALAGVERVAQGCYSRTISLGAHQGWLSVSAAHGAHALSVECSLSLAPVLGPLLAALRRLFDLNARPDVIAAHLGRDPYVGAAVCCSPGLRVPGSVSGFEVAWRAVLGQRISVRAAGVLADRLVARFGAPLETPCPALIRLSPTAGHLAAAQTRHLQALGISRIAAEAIRRLAADVAAGNLRLEPGVDLDETVAQLQDLPGVGPWTAQYIAMRALGWPDALPEGDLALRRRLGNCSAGRLRQLSEGWRPWRSYAVLHAWNLPSNIRHSHRGQRTCTNAK